MHSPYDPPARPPAKSFTWEYLQHSAALARVWCSIRATFWTAELYSGGAKWGDSLSPDCGACQVEVETAAFEAVAALGERAAAAQQLLTSSGALLASVARTAFARSSVNSSLRYERRI